MSSTDDLRAVPDPATMLASVPDGTDRDEVFDWAVGAPPFRDGAATYLAVRSTLEQMAWRRIERSVRFWGDDISVLTRAATSMAAGWSHLGAPVGLAARSSQNGLDLRVGAQPAHMSGIAGTMAANLPGLELGAPTRGLTSLGTAHAYLWAVPDPDADPMAPAVLDRLCELQGIEWALEVLAVPVPSALLRQRCIALAHLGVALASERTHQVQVDPRTTRTYEDPVVVRLEEAVAVEHDRTQRCLDVGCLAVFARLSAPDTAQLAAAAGAASGAAPSAGTKWRAGPMDSGALPAALIAANESADLLRPPRRDVHGLPSRHWVELDEHPELLTGPGPSIVIGSTRRGASLSVPLNHLTNHVLITGASGSGKSTHLASLLVQLGEAQVPYWVVEPVKDEYRSLNLSGLRVWTPGAPDPGTGWPLNPLEVPEGTAVATHVDRLVALFRASFGLPDPLPHLLELGLTSVYEAAGWDLGSDRNLRHSLAHRDLDWPTVSDLLEVCTSLPARLDYEAQVQGNLRAAFEARLGGLLRGPRGRTIDRSDPFPIEEALTGPVVINLDAIGDDDARSFFMGLLLIRLHEARRAAPCADLAHVTVIEEAHRLLGQPSHAPGVEGANPTGHVAEAFTDLLAEIRSTGEGLVIVEQSPSRLVRGALVNTGTKIVLRSTDRDDHQALTAALGLEPSEGTVLSTLGRHEALVMWEGMDRPVRARLDARMLTQLPAPVATSKSSKATVPARLAQLPEQVRTAAAMLVRADVGDHPRARHALLEALGTALPDTATAVVEELFVHAIDREIARLARARGWSRAARLAAVHSVIQQRFDTDHPRSRLELGRQPHLACPAVCPNGGCLTGELLAPEALKVLREGPGTLIRLAGDPEERRRRLSRRVSAAIPADAPSHLRDHGQRCLTVQVFDEWADPDTVAALLPGARSSEWSG